MMFHPDYPGLQMALRREGGDEADAAASSFHFVSASRAANPLDVSRQRDRLLLFVPRARAAPALRSVSACSRR